jgi:YVTN family beta-propeller protein
VRRLWITIGVTVALVLSLAGVAAATGLLRAGPRGNGTAVSPVGFLVTPAGQQATLGGLPLGAAASPDGRHLLVTNNGQGVQSLQVLDLSDAADGPEVAQTIPYKSPEALFVGVAYSPDGKRAYASAGGNNKIRVYTVDGKGTLAEQPALPLPTTNPAGQKVNMFPAGLAVAPDGRTLYVADQLADALSAVDTTSGAVRTIPVGHNPLSVALTADGRRAYVTNQGADSVTVVDTSTFTAVREVRVGSHPNRLALDARKGLLYVSVGDDDKVAIVDTAAGVGTTADKVVATIDLAPYRGAPVGSNPGGLALSPDGSRLYVANSGNNDVAVIDTRSRRTVGLIPTGWYPSAVVTSRDGRTLYALNAKGLGAGPNNGPGHPNPYQPATSPDQYVGSMIKGTLSAITLNGDKLKRWTEQVVRNNGFDERDQVRTAGNRSRVVPIHPGETSPIKHVIYVVKENRTYDQVFGSLGRGAGDPSLNLFGDESAPNIRALARRYATLDNFYADAEVSAQGWNWSVAANSNQYVEQSWPANYSGRNRPYDYEGGNPATAPNRDPKHAYIWQRLADAGVSLRNYGFYADTNGVTDPKDPALGANTNHAFPGYDLSKPDHCDATLHTGRMCEWLRDFKQYEATGNLPAVQFVRLPNDHTAGTRVGAPTPKAYVADNDYAVGQLVDAVSHSKYWESTAIFITEDDAQNGPDHIDAHRTEALVVSPYTQAGRVDSTFYSTVSMLRTMELIVGIRPMTQFDTYANAMLGTFSDRPDNSAYDAARPAQPFTEVNAPNAPMAAESAAQQLGKEDQINERTFNEAIWQSIKGAGSVMPEPQHRLDNRAPAVADADGDGK